MVRMLSPQRDLGIRNPNSEKSPWVKDPHEKDGCQPTINSYACAVRPVKSMRPDGASCGNGSELTVKRLLKSRVVEGGALSAFGSNSA